ncbi:MAG: Fe-S oxidoreductase [Proteobacteria bacterium]|nr:Fe-S oxidoreductase [Pseudomonadota bacterium]
MGCSDILGISTPLGSLHRLQGLVTRWRAIPPDRRPLLVFGGLIATFAPDALLKEFPEAVLVIGEGEEALVRLTEVVGLHPEVLWRQVFAEASIPNLMYQAGDQVIRTVRRNINLRDAPPPDRPFLNELLLRGGIVRAEASRGCSYGRCSFCAIQHKYCDEAGWRDVKISRIVQELGDLSLAGARHPYFTDEDFIGNDPLRALALARAIEREKSLGRISSELTLYVDMRAASVLARGNAGRPSGLAVLKGLQAAGLREVFVGIESGAVEQVQRYKKPATTQRNLQALHRLRDLGLEVDIGFIFFDPEMTLDEAATNLDFLRHAGLWNHYARLTKEVRLEAGTPLVELYRQKDLIAGPLDVDELTFPYRWRDTRVEAVHNTFRAWERLDGGRVYELQAASRGEVPSENLRRRRCELLGQVRAVELDVLHSIVDSTQQNKDSASLDLSPFTQRRSDLLDSWQYSERSR